MFRILFFGLLLFIFGTVRAENVVVADLLKVQRNMFFPPNLAIDEEYGIEEYSIDEIENIEKIRPYYNKDKLSKKLRFDINPQNDTIYILFRIDPIDSSDISIWNSRDKLHFNAFCTEPYENIIFTPEFCKTIEEWDTLDLRNWDKKYERSRTFKIKYTIEQARIYDCFLSRYIYHEGKLVCDTISFFDPTEGGRYINEILSYQRKDRAYDESEEKEKDEFIFRLYKWVKKIRKRINDFFK